jgi:very-short-patch-repair endonuclease
MSPRSDIKKSGAGIQRDLELARQLYAQPPSPLEATLGQHMRAAGLTPEREYRFHPTRRWRFDFAFTEQKLAVECEGGSWVNGRHVRGAGFEADTEKYNAAAMQGWTVLRFTSRMIKSGEALKQIEQVLSASHQLQREVRKPSTRAEEVGQ